MSPGRSLRDDERGLVGKSLVVSMVLVLLVGLALVEGGSILFAKLQVQDLAQATAVEGAATLRNTNSAAVAVPEVLETVPARWIETTPDAPASAARW